jgi:hypothetical protein
MNTRILTLSRSHWTVRVLVGALWRNAGCIAITEAALPETPFEVRVTGITAHFPSLEGAAEWLIERTRR